MDENALRQELTRISIKTYERGLIGGTGGNISARLGEDVMLITPSGLALCDTTVENIVRVDIQSGEWEAVEPFIPSKEYRFHLAIYAVRLDVLAIVHCHSRYATAYAVRKMDIPYVTDAAFKQPPMPHVSFSPSGSEDLVEKVREATRQNPGFRTMLLDEHGIISVGADLVQAYNFADLAEEMAQIALLSSLI